MSVKRYYYQWWDDCWAVFDRDFDTEMPIANCSSKYHAMLIQEALEAAKGEKHGQQKRPNRDHGNAAPEAQGTEANLKRLNEGR